MIQQEQATEATIAVAWVLGKHKNPFSDSEIINVCKATLCVTSCQECTRSRGRLRFSKLTYMHACMVHLPKLLNKPRDNVTSRTMLKFLCIENPFLVRNVTEFSVEAQKVCTWTNTASLQS